jgi:hypothetical protein
MLVASSVINKALRVGRSTSSASGTPIVSLDADGDVTLEVQTITPKKGPVSFGFIIVNTSGGKVTGQVKLIY